MNDKKNMGSPDYPPRTIVGYGWPWTVRPGETIDFMVSTYGKTAQNPWQADLVRVMCGLVFEESDSFTEITQDAPFTGEYPGRHQPVYTGSYVEVPAHKVLDSLDSFTVQTFVYPTLIGEPVARVDGSVTDTRFGSFHNDNKVHGEQTLISRFDNSRQVGWSLFIDKEGKLTFKAGTGSGDVHKVVLPRPLIERRWFLVSGQYDAAQGILRITAKGILAAQPAEYSWVAGECAERSLPAGVAVPQQGPLRFGAATDGPGHGARMKPIDILNGKLDSVRLTQGVLAADEIDAVSGPEIPQRLTSRIVGFWDFGQGIGTVKVHDLSANTLHGTTVNLPTRAVMGVRWDGSQGRDWTQARDHFSACKFNDDDLYDAEWQPAFSYTVPDDLPSGIYAARLTQGDAEDYIPFFVAPGQHQPTASVALLLPTASYTAYTSFDGHQLTFVEKQVTEPDGHTKTVREPFFDVDIGKLAFNPADNDFMWAHPELGRGVYSRHSDGSPMYHASQKHPNFFLKLKGHLGKLAPDTAITGLLHHHNMDVDIITDDLLQAEGADLLKDYRVIMTGHHPEYYSREMLQGMEDYLADGGRCMYLGSNGIWKVTPVHSELPGVVEVRLNGLGIYDAQYDQKVETTMEFDGLGGGFWPDNNRSAHQVWGVGRTTLHLGKGAPYRRQTSTDDPRTGFIFAGVNDTIIGDFGPTSGAVWGEVDSFDVYYGSPSHAVVLASSTDGKVPGDVVFFETATGGAVFSIGTWGWNLALPHNNYDNPLAIVTLNVLRRFLDETPFRIPDM